MIHFTQLEINKMFAAIGNTLPYKAEITVCGGTSIVLAHKYRDATEDIDCIQCDTKVLEIAKTIGDKYKLDNWLNTDVMVTPSYTKELLKWRTPYKVYGNLMVYLISGAALLCMKLKSFRSNSNDFRDCENLINTCKEEGYTFDDIRKMYTGIYAVDSTMSVEAERFLKDKMNVSQYTLDTESIESYISMLQDKLLTPKDIPEQFRIDILHALCQRDKYISHIQTLLFKHQSTLTYFDIYDILPKHKLSDNDLEGVIKFIIDSNN